MEVKSAYEVYGQNSLHLGQMDEYGVVRLSGKVVLRVVRGSIFSMHGSYMGKCKNGVGKSDRGQLLFTLKPI